VPHPFAFSANGWDTTKPTRGGLVSGHDFTACGKIRSESREVSVVHRLRRPTGNETSANLLTCDLRVAEANLLHLFKNFGCPTLGTSLVLCLGWDTTKTNKGGLVSGHDFSRAEKQQNVCWALAPAATMFQNLRTIHQPLRAETHPTPHIFALPLFSKLPAMS
jgi:hypothetical protein